MSAPPTPLTPPLHQALEGYVRVDTLVTVLDATQFAAEMDPTTAGSRSEDAGSADDGSGSSEEESGPCRSAGSRSEDPPCQEGLKPLAELLAEQVDGAT